MVASYKNFLNLVDFCSKQVVYEIKYSSIKVRKTEKVDYKSYWWDDLVGSWLKVILHFLWFLQEVNLIVSYCASFYLKEPC